MRLVLRSPTVTPTAPLRRLPGRQTLHMMPSLSRLISWVVSTSCRRPMLTVVLSVGLAAISIAYGAITLTFEASMLQLLPKGTPYVMRYQDYSKEFGELDTVVIVVEGRTTAESKAYTARLTGLLQQGSISFHRLTYRTDPGQ